MVREYTVRHSIRNPKVLTPFTLVQGREILTGQIVPSVYHLLILLKQSLKTKTLCMVLSYRFTRLDETTLPRPSSIHLLTSNSLLDLLINRYSSFCFGRSFSFICKKFQICLFFILYKFLDRLYRKIDYFHPLCPLSLKTVLTSYLSKTV